MTDDNTNEGIENQDTDSNTSTDVNQAPAASTAAKQGVPVENRIAELTRKMNNSYSKMDEKIDQLINYVQTVSNKPSAGNATTYSTQHEGDEAVAYTNVAVNKIREEMLVEKQRASFEKAIDLFPELDPKSDHFDEEFYKEVDTEFRQQSLSRDPNAPLKAAKLVALDKGKIEKLQRAQVMADESRRTRILSEGGSTPNKASKAKSGVTDSLRTLGGLLGVKPESIEKFMKTNSKKYGAGE